MERIGKYELVRELGRGATATVYLARDPFAGREVAIKLAFPEVLKDPVRGRLQSHLFLNEASLVGKLNHPHIAQIFDAVVDDPLCYLVMEYVPGGTLEPFCEPERLPAIDRVVEIVFKCTRALDFAHRLGITHRDIKPANILVCDGGHDAVADGGPIDIKISDFGAAITGGTECTQVNGIGSPAYMSPEQVREQALDQRTDIYSLGVVMYRLLTGQLPFQASSHYNMIYQILHAEPTPVARLRPELPPALADIVARAMARDRDERYPDWTGFAQDLARYFQKRASPRRDFADTEKFETLRALPFFSDFSDVDIWETVRFSEWRFLPAGESIMRSGETGDFFCFVAEGELKVTRNGRALDLLTAGDCFGEMAVIGRRAQARSADVSAVTDAKVVCVREEALRQASEACRMHFYEGFLDVLANRLALANERLSAV